MEVHILNGDSLKDQFPKSIQGELIVARECLVDGDVSGSDLKTFFKNRNKFLTEAYQIGPDDYQNTISEFEKITNIAAGSTINLWFEDDLFCQTNLWFCSFLILTNTKNVTAYLVRPNTDIQHGFGGLSLEGLIERYRARKKISSQGLKTLCQLWLCYQSNNITEMTDIAEKARKEFPFLTDVVTAHRERISTNSFLGRPQTVIRKIIDELGTSEFGQVFREFNKQESIYGFGDMQVKRLMKDLEVQQDSQERK